MDDKTKLYLKWGIVAGLLGIGLFFALPILATMVWNAVSVAVGALALVGLWFFLPAIAEWMAQGSYWVWEKAIRGNPVGKLWRELAEFDKEINSLELNIANAITSKVNMESMLKQQRSVFDPDEIMEWQNNIDATAADIEWVKNQRDELRVEYRAMERDCKKAEAHWQLALAQGKVADALDKAGKITGGTAGARVAVQEIQNRLAQSRARLEVIKSRRPGEARPPKAELAVVDIPAKPQIKYDPTPSVTAPAWTNNQPVPVAKSRVESLIDKL